MICTSCRSLILESGQARGDHHFGVDIEGWAVEDLSTEDLVSNTQKKGNHSKCLICWRLARNLPVRDDDSLDRWLKPTDESEEGLPDIPVYRWTLRKAAKIDEMDDYFVLTFKPILIDELNQSKYKSRDQIPDVVFYFLKEQGTLLENQLSESTGECWDQISRWLKDCESHKRCHRVNEFMPKRLVDVGLGSIPELQDHSKLRIVQDLPSQPYVTLSHSWGPKGKDPERLYPFPQLLKAVEGGHGTFEEFTDSGVPWKRICEGSKNFAHAILVARQLGINYIWIDSLCIIQNDRDDWATEAQKMHEIYKNTYCNISASDSVLPADGLFRAKRLEAYEGQNSSTIEFRGKTWRIIPADLWEVDLLKSPLYERGWVFQERMLSPRMLHFASHQIFWDCATKSACEAFPQGIPAQLDWVASIERNWRGLLQNNELQKFGESGDTANSRSLFWKRAVRNYTACKLTNHQDKLIALWGIAGLLRNENDEYGNGLWSHELAEQLSWSVVDSRHAKRRPDSAPYWSWASIENGIIEVGNQWPHFGRFYSVKGHDGEPINFQGPKQPSNPESSRDDTKIDQVSSKIEMYGLLSSKCSVTKEDSQGQRWHLDIPGHPETAASIQVFMDTNECEKECRFIILTAFKESQDQHYLYSGTGILMEGDGDVYRRAGLIKFQEVGLITWLDICRICGQQNNMSDDVPAENEYSRVCLE